MHSGNYVLKQWGLLLLMLMLLPAAFNLKAAFSKGFRDYTLVDPQRSNREIPIRIWYPAETEGMNVAVSDGSFPVISFGHGWGMRTELYQPLVDRMVPVGYVLIMVNTETAIFIPDHAALGKDLAFTLQWFRDQHQQVGSPFEGKAGDKFALMGHSMGGGASVLSGNDPALVNLLILLAPADTNPSSIAAAPSIIVPTLLFSGGGDAVTSPAGVHQPMFNALGSACKFFINIKGGNHCYFALDDPMGCDLLESLTGSQTLIERTVQQDILFDLMMPALDYFLKSNEESLQTFLDSMATAIRTEISGSCDPSTLHNDQSHLKTQVYPQPAANWLRVNVGVPDHQIATIKLFELSGKALIVPFIHENNEILIVVENLNSGIYLLEITYQKGQQTHQTISIAH
jgi:dienelactone hydrolase